MIVSRWYIVAVEADHIALANKNHDALVQLARQPERHAEWVATIAFYKAVQVVEAVLASELGRHSNGHDARLDFLKRTKFAEIFKAYRPLYSASLVARYLVDSSRPKLENKQSITYHTFADYMSPEDVVRKLLKKRLDVLEQKAVGFLTDVGKQKLLRIGKCIDGDAVIVSD